MESAGLFALSVKQPLWRKLSATAWDVYNENVFNSALLQLDGGSKGSPVERFGLGHPTGRDLAVSRRSERLRLHAAR
ncbi:MAG: hypothetical protein IPO17_15365 [Flavobacteriales bacterium]|nr:hypothetical protein [Flavobacteriales bacterium]